ncbi:uncharacterized protein LOC128397707 [Panonychus citri]|uniref:uncharacterized protein LOC128397707 n=1 Tax=Panonychus citri TaxID=50023 RepID=UPI002306E852|nr:uncharacterized protein LOC128397707 [Panonychus citri]
MAEFRPEDDELISERYSIGSGVKSQEYRVSGATKMTIGTKSRKVTSKNEKIRKLDEAICELEEIYASLNLDDEDLFDRAERRDMPSKFQLMRENSVISDSDLEVGETVPGRRMESPQFPSASTKNSIYPLETGWSHPYCDEFFQSRHRNLGSVESLLSSADPPHRCKAPARRRSAIPDPINDDLAARKMVRNRNEKSSGSKKIQSYLLLSPIYSPTTRTDISTEMISPENYLSTEPKPDIEKDDLSYRRFIQSDAAAVSPPHPPFGIPIGPTDLTTINNYVHATLSEKDKNFFYYRVKPYYPHLIKDDMAFRSFRKDLVKSPDELRKSWINGIKLFPVTTQHLINQRNESQSRSSSTDSIGSNQDHLDQYYQLHHQHPTRSFHSSGFQSQSSLV